MATRVKSKESVITRWMRVAIWVTAFGAFDSTSREHHSVGCHSLPCVRVHTVYTVGRPAAFATQAAAPGRSSGVAPTGRVFATAAHRAIERFSGESDSTTVSSGVLSRWYGNRLNTSPLALFAVPKKKASKRETRQRQAFWLRKTPAKHVKVQQNHEAETA
eukprot:GHVT01072913.1.p1 GENE.GHVT01072913.1~~GHVT01072913.1.p1  ORF type:complete len:161 (+),score=11.11 GHVT01072913.1:762-1244(+)